MKKIYLLAAAIGVASAVEVSATDFKVDGINYTTIDATTVKVTGSDEFPNKVLTIPGYVTNAGTEYTVTTVGKSAFEGKRWIYELNLPSTLQKVEQSAFASCTYIEKPIVLPEGLTRIEQNAFEQCMSIPSVTLPESLTYMGSYAFRRCYELTTFKIGPNLSSIGTGVISNNSKIARVDVDPANKSYTSQAGLVYSKDLKTLFIVPAATQSVTIPETVTKFADYSFSSCTNLKTLVVPNSVTSIGYACFEDCDHLENITLSTSMKSLGACTFYKNYALKNIVIPDNFVTLEDWCFFLLSGLEKVKIGKGVTKMNGCPFTLCDNIKLLEIEATVPPTCQKDPVSKCVYTNATLIVPEGSVEAYKAADYWKNFTNIKAASGYGNNLELKKYIDGRMKAGNDMKIRFNVFNAGNDDVKTIEYTLVADGASTTKSLEGLSIPAYSTGKLEIPVSLAIGKHTGSFTINKVNGLANANASKSTTWNIEVVQSVEIPADADEASWAHGTSMEHYGGYNSYDKYEGAMRFVDPDLIGYKVVGMKVDDVIGDDMKDFIVWNSTTLGEHNGEEAEATYDPNTGILKGAFCNPVTLTKDGLFFGFAMNRAVSDNITYVIPCSRGEEPMAGSFYGKLGDEGYTDWSEYGYLPLTLYVQGPTKPNNVKIIKINCLPAAPMGEQFSFPFTVQNYGGNEIETLEISYKINGQDKAVTSLLLPNLDKTLSKKQVANLEFEAIEQGGNYDLDIAITKVNGQPNEQSSLICKVPLTVAEFKTVHRPMLEEYTGTGCGFCPRGTLGLMEMAKRNPNFIGAAWHRYNNADPMYSSIGHPFSAPGAPGCQIDRDGNPTDPYFGDNNLPMGIQDLYSEAERELSPANINVSSTWNSDKTQLDVKTTCKFAYNEDKKTYKVGYLLTIDGLKNTDPECAAAWKQNNTYRGGSSDPLLNTLREPGGEFDLSVYNHVVFDASCARGVTELPATIELGKDIECTHSFVIANNTLADQELIPASDLSKVNVIAFIVDNTGRIRNAVKASAGQSSATGIEEGVAQVETATPVYYDLMGRRVAEPQHGLYIKVEGQKATKILM